MAAKKAKGPVKHVTGLDEPDPQFVQQLLSFVEGAGPGMGRWAPFESWMIENGYTKAAIEANCKAIYAAAGMTR